jgi:hypothetical protein
MAAVPREEDGFLMKPQTGMRRGDVWQAIAIIEGILLLLIGVGIWSANRSLDDVPHV